ncbi:hypothetical protein A2Z54_00345, partial [Candidatus Curtissbacteria bacterium RIFCSPHIGHO2_02_39_8]
MNKIKTIKSLTKKEIDSKLARIKKTFIGIPVFKGKNGYPYSLFPLTDFKPAMKPQLIEDMADLLVYYGDFENANIIVSEADRGGGPLTHAVSMRTNLPYTLANWYPTEVEGSISVKASIGFSGDGVINLNGVEKGQKAILVDDIISSGGTAIALIECIQKAGAHVVEALFVGEKVNLNGR